MNFIDYFSVSTFTFFLGLGGIFFNRKNVLLIIMCVELMLLALNFNFLNSACYIDDVLGQVFAVFILTVAAAESSIGLAILVIYNRARGTISVVFINLLKG